jgi:hypothetical protein
MVRRVLSIVFGIISQSRIVSAVRGLICRSVDRFRFCLVIVLLGIAALLFLRSDNRRPSRCFRLGSTGGLPPSPGVVLGKLTHLLDLALGRLIGDIKQGLEDVVQFGPASFFLGLAADAGNFFEATQITARDAKQLLGRGIALVVATRPAGWFACVPIPARIGR